MSAPVQPGPAAFTEQGSWFAGAMLSTVLVEHPWLVPAGLLGLVLLGPPVGALLVGRRQIAWALLAVTLFVVAALTLTPTARDLSVGCAVEWSWPKLGAVETAANLILFAPITLLAGVITRRPWFVAVIASGGSLVIESIQAVATVLGRSCSTNDWWFNTLGALFGALLAVVALRIHRTRGARSSKA